MLASTVEIGSPSYWPLKFAYALRTVRIKRGNSRSLSDLPSDLSAERL